MSNTAEISPLPMLDKLQRLAKEHMGVSAHECTPDFDFKGIDGLNIISFYLAIEADFQLVITEQESYNLKTFGDVINLVEGKI